MIHLASCKNNQLAHDGTEDDKTSYFTKHFKSMFENDEFNGTYKEMYNRLKDYLNPNWQEPNWDNHNDSLTNNFEKMKAFE